MQRAAELLVLFHLIEKRRAVLELVGRRTRPHGIFESPPQQPVRRVPRLIDGEERCPDAVLTIGTDLVSKSSQAPTTVGASSQNATVASARMTSSRGSGRAAHAVAS